MNKLDTTYGLEWNVIEEHDLERISNHEGIKSHDDLLWDVCVDDKIDKNFCYGILLKYKDYNWRIAIFPKEYKTRTETANLLDFVTVDFIENFKRDEYYADCRKFSEKFRNVSHDESIYDYDSNWQTNSDSFYIRYSCDFDKDLKTLPSPWAIISFSARIIDKTIFIEDYYTKIWYYGPLLNDPIGSQIPSSPYKQLLDFFVYKREPTIRDIKNHIKSKLSDCDVIVKKYEKNISVNAIVTACKKLDNEYETFSEKLLIEYKKSAEYVPDSRYAEAGFKIEQRTDFEGEISSKLNELWNLLEYIIYFKYFDEIYENGFSRSPKTFFFDHASISNMEINKDFLYQNSSSSNMGFYQDNSEVNGYLFEICKKLIVGPDWYFKDFFLDDMNDDFDDGWSYPNSYEESSDDEKDTFY